MRTKCTWYNEGEKNSKCFFSLEKRHYKNGVISLLKLGDNKFAISDKEILYECETVDRIIYSYKADYNNSRINDLCFGNTSKSMNHEEKEKLEGMLTKAQFRHRTNLIRIWTDPNKVCLLIQTSNLIRRT